MNTPVRRVKKHRTAQIATPDRAVLFGIVKKKIALLKKELASIETSMQQLADKHSTKHVLTRIVEHND